MGDYILQSISWGEGIHYSTKMICKANSLDNKKVYYDVYSIKPENENTPKKINISNLKSMVIVAVVVAVVTIVNKHLQSLKTLF